MASIYTSNQREALESLSVYDYMYSKLKPPVGYGDTFYIHINHRRGEITGAKSPGGISVSAQYGYKNWSNGASARDGRSGIQAAYALMDYYNSVGGGSYNCDDPHDFAEIIAEIAADMGIPQDNTSVPRPKKRIQPRKPENMLEKYNKAIALNRPPIEVPVRAECGSYGHSPDSEIIRYMEGRGIDSKITRSLIDAGLLYLSETAAYYEVERDDNGNFVKDDNGQYKFKLNEHGNKIPQVYIDQATGELRTKMLYNLVFTSKDQSPANAFFERKPLGKRGQAYIAANASPAGYFSFTGHLPSFQQADVPTKTRQNMKAYICEAPIDAISLYALHQQLGITEPAEYISISGASKDLAIQRAICEGYDCILAFDNDGVGKSRMDARRPQAFIDPQTNREVSLPAIVPPKIAFELRNAAGNAEYYISKDWNDVLLALVKGNKCSKDPAWALTHGSSTALAPKPVIFNGLEDTVNFLRKEPVLPISPRCN